MNAEEFQLDYKLWKFFYILIFFLILRKHLLDTDFFILNAQIASGLSLRIFIGMSYTESLSPTQIVQTIQYMCDSGHRRFNVFNQPPELNSERLFLRLYKHLLSDAHPY